MRKLLIALTLMSFAICGVTMAAVENIKVSGDISASAITRDLDLGNTTTSGGARGDTATDSEDYLFSQIRLRFDADLTEGVSAVVQVISEEHWGENNTDDIEIDLAYIQLEEFLYEPLTLIVGAQNLRYGNALIIGDPDTNQLVTTNGASAFANVNPEYSLRKSFDAVRAILDYAPYTIDTIYAKIDENNTNQEDDITLAGINVAYDWSSYNGVTEAYVFYAAGRQATELAVENNEDRTVALGARVQWDPNDKWTVGLEGAHQFGDEVTLGGASAANSLKRDAWAGQASVDYRFLNDYNGKVGFKYTYLSGDGDNSDSSYQAWDPMFEDQTPGEILNILMTNSNAHYFSLSGSYMPREDVTLGLLYTYAMLVEEYTATPTLTGTAGSAVNGNIYEIRENEDQFGSEIDAYAIYDYTEDVQLQLTGAFFIPGDVFDDNNDSLAYSVRGTLSVDF